MTMDWHRRHPVKLTLEDHARRQVARMRAGTGSGAIKSSASESLRRRRGQRTRELAGLDPWTGVMG